MRQQNSTTCAKQPLCTVILLSIMFLIAGEQALEGEVGGLAGLDTWGGGGNPLCTETPGIWPERGKPDSYCTGACKFPGPGARLIYLLTLDQGSPAMKMLSNQNSAWSSLSQYLDLLIVLISLWLWFYPFWQRLQQLMRLLLFRPKSWLVAVLLPEYIPEVCGRPFPPTKSTPRSQILNAIISYYFEWPFLYQSGKSPTQVKHCLAFIASFDCFSKATMVS